MRGICHSHNVSRSPRWQTASRHDGSSICWDSDEFTRSVMHSCWDLTRPCFCLIRGGLAQRTGCDVESWSDDWKNNTAMTHPYKCHTFASLQTKSRLAYAETVVPPPSLFIGMNSDYTDQTWQKVFCFIDHPLGPTSPLRAPNPNYKHVANKWLYLNDMQPFFLFLPIFFCAIGAFALINDLATKTCKDAFIHLLHHSHHRQDVLRDSPQGSIVHLGVGGACNPISSPWADK